MCTDVDRIVADSFISAYSHICAFCTDAMHELWIDHTQNAGSMHPSDATETLNWMSMIDRLTILIVLIL